VFSWVLDLDEGMRIDVIKRDTHKMEILVYMGEDIIFRHLVELNPEVFSEEEAEALMQMWAQIIKTQIYLLSEGKSLVEKLFKSLFRDDSEDEEYS